MATLYQMAAEMIIKGKTRPINGSSVDTLLKTESGRRLIRNATGFNPPPPNQRGFAGFDWAFTDRFNERQFRMWLELHAMDIYTYLNMYIEAGGHYPLGFFNSLVERGFLPANYAQTNWRKNVLPHHFASRRTLHRRIVEIERRARKNCW
jgi:hypothetical protein